MKRTSLLFTIATAAMMFTSPACWSAELTPSEVARTLDITSFRNSVRPGLRPGTKILAQNGFTEISPVEGDASSVEVWLPDRSWLFEITVLRSEGDKAVVCILDKAEKALATTSASAQSSRASLCRPPEAVLFACRVGSKTVSICGQGERGGAVYRYGRPGRVELEASDVRRAHTGWWGGGETQAYIDTPTHRYVVYDRMVRTGFDDEGHNLSEMTQGLVVQSGGRTLSSQECAQPLGREPPGFDQRLLETLVPEGDYVPH